MKNTIKLAMVSAAMFAASSAFAADCQKVSSDVTVEITKAPENVLSLVSQFVADEEAEGTKVF